jgi:lipoprotein-anchoring transpeptidase ErfK/SrfK
MGRKTQIAIAIGVVVLASGAIAAYAYDSSQNGKIADGVTIGGVDVGGMEATEAKRAIRQQLLAPLRHSISVNFGSHRWNLAGDKLKIHANLDGAVEEALSASRQGGILGRVVRYVSDSAVEKNVSPHIAYSPQAVNRFVRRVAATIDREPQNASVEANGDSLEFVPAQYGRKVRDNQLTHQLNTAVLNANAPHAIFVRVHRTKPDVATRREVAAEYPSYLTLDRSTFTLRLWLHLKPARTYTVAVGQEGLETPAGLYHIQEKQENPSWHVPNSAWAGALAGKVIPPGPEDPIKARWMGIFEGAGIHGTEETWSLGQAASHGCVRMSIPDVEELYDLVEVGTPIYIG